MSGIFGAGLGWETARRDVTHAHERMDAAGDAVRREDDAEPEDDGEGQLCEVGGRLPGDEGAGERRQVDDHRRADHCSDPRPTAADDGCDRSEIDRMSG